MIQRAIVAGVLVKNGKALIIKRIKDETSYPNIWELPSGKVELLEDPNKGVIREFKEETGIRVTVVKPLSVSHFVSREKPEVRHNVQVFYLVKSKSSKVKLSSEHQAYAWITKKEFKKYRLFKDISDAIALALKENK